MKYKIVKCGHPNGREGSGIIGGDIIELEPLDCSASECDGGECECTAQMKCFGDTFGFAEYKPKESLVSIDDVLKVFDDAHIGKSILMTDDGLCFIQHIKGIRSAIEQMKRS